MLWNINRVILWFLRKTELEFEQLQFLKKNIKSKRKNQANLQNRLFWTGKSDSS